MIKNKQKIKFIKKNLKFTILVTTPKMLCKSTATCKVRMQKNKL
jgi:hypothetical protein